ncbi:PREDICTED: keratin, type I cytoskeletal 9-like [Ipomoea nil]|uniref:keratin, type I cytoskeletal 9-like n=1 Tax=Ipomoea nil TaxID=35883 RepID=UPI000901F55F|nr:PREDICTED: keratin, type I cytoskeletal 9-like [Ipomoea nil]
MASSLTVSDNPVTLPQLADFLQAQVFIATDDLSPGLTGGGSPAALYVAQGSNQSGGGAGGRRGNSGGGRGNRGSRGGQWRGGRGGRGGGGQPAPQENLIVAGDDVASSTGSWFPDTGASAHATPDASMLSQSSEYNGGDVLRVGNGTGFDHTGNSA